jgi:choline-phosphate cytidylyltransferase
LGLADKFFSYIIMNGTLNNGRTLSSQYSDHSNSNFTARTTEGWLELFLNAPEKFKFGQWQEEIRDRSMSNKIMRPFFDYLAQYVPPNVAPNVLSLFGLATLGQAWYIMDWYGESFPTLTTWLAVVAIQVFFVTNSVSNIHADHIRQRTALGELFKYSCDCASTVFLSILTTYCLGGTKLETQWYTVQIAQLVLFLKHLSAFHRNAGLRYNVLTGPGEVIFTAVSLLAIRAIFGLDWMADVYEFVVDLVLQKAEIVATTEQQLNKLDKYQRDPGAVASEAIMVGYYTIYAAAVLKSLSLQKPHGWSRFGLSASLLMRVVPALLFQFTNTRQSLGVGDVICDGLFMAVLTSDITLAKMAGRELHPWVVLMSFATILSHSSILALCLVYYIAVFADLCAYLNMPLLTTCRNVYCDGVYDLCHIGHKRLFQKALQHGNRLYVGVVGDEDANAYKRPPIMSHDERCAEVEACKAVTKVIQNSPCFGLTKEFLDEHQIHIVAYGEEYLERYPDPKDDPYYRVPRETGIARPLPRTQGLSTSDLIRRIQAARPADVKKSPT